MKTFILLTFILTIPLFANNTDIKLTHDEKNWLDKNPINRVAVMNYWPHNKNGNSLHTEILKLINRYSGLNLVPIKYDTWKEGFGDASLGEELHGIMGLSWSKERENTFIYSPAYDFTPAYLITKSINKEINTLNNLKNKTIYLKTNSITHKLMKQKSPSTKIIDISNINDIYKRLSTTNEADAMLAYFIDNEKLEEYNLKIVQKVYDRYGEVAIGINKQYKHLSSIINKTFKLIPKKEFSAIRDKDWNTEYARLSELTKKEKDYLKKKEMINICINPNWEPIEFSDNGTAKGISIDILNIVKDKLQIKYNFIKTASWKESQEFLKNKRCDILPSAVKTLKRAEYANFTKPYLNYDLAIITTADKPLINNLQSITGKTMSRKEGSGLISKLKKKYPYINIKESKSYKESLQQVMDGDVYFTIATIPVFSYYKSKYGLKNLQVAGYTNMKYNLSVAVRKDDTALLNILNKTLSSIPKSTYNVVHDKWATAKVIKQTNWKLILQITAVILLLTIVLIWNNRKLKIMVDSKTADIKKQKQELELLISSFDKNVIFSRTDLKGNITHASEAFCNISGYKLEELIGKPHNILRHPDMPKEIFKEIWYALQNETCWSGDIKNIRKDGSFYWVHTHFEPDYNSSGKLIGYSALRQDITDKIAVDDLSKNLEQKVNERTIELEIAKQEIEEIHKLTQESIEYASLIQHSLIPDNNIFREYFSDYFAIWHPKDTVGGDIYLLENINENECILMVIDCTGHGVPGAFVTMLVKAIERQILSQVKHSSNKEISPAYMLKIFNKNMKYLLKQENSDSLSNAGFDGGILYFNKKEMIVKFSGAETPLFYTQDGNLKVIKGNRHSIGYKKSDASYEFKEHTIEVKKGMQFYITTDGYLDQNGGEKGFPFSKKRFSNIIKEYSSESFADQQEVFLEELYEYQGEEDRNDDVTLIGFKI